MSYLGKLIATTLCGVSVFVFTSGTDPVNVPKLFLLGIFSFAVVGTLVHPKARVKFKKLRTPVILVLLFNLFSLLSVLNSQAPLSQSLYGVYGRNNGYLLYLFLSLLFVASLTIFHSKDFKGVIFALLFSGFINIGYATWVLIFGDFIPWENPYGNLLGTFGNPNFAGSFFGILSTVPLSYCFSKGSTVKIRILCVLFLIFIFVAIVQTHAVQGKVLFLFSTAFIIFIKLRFSITNKFIKLGYLSGLLVLGTFSILGALQIGPLTKFIYKESVSLRGQYWYAGWKTGISHPFFGVGFDSYGDWYRLSRRESALIRPGIDTVSNTAHNVFLDIFSFGGWPLLLIYAALTFYVLKTLVKKVFQEKEFDPIFASISTAWLCYQLQSLISINQVGLSIWGWVLGAVIISHSQSISDPKTILESRKKGNSRSREISVISPNLMSGIFGFIGLMIVLPPLKSDVSWKSALDSRDAAKVEKALEPSYFNPVSTQRYSSAVALFEISNLKELALKYALLGVKYNPRSYEAWKNLYQIEKSSNSEKRQALSMMKKLDPKNPTLESFE